MKTKKVKKSNKAWMLVQKSPARPVIFKNRRDARFVKSSEDKIVHIRIEVL